MKNWQGQEGLSAKCQLDPLLVFACYAGKEHPCDRCNIDRDECQGFPRKPSHAGELDRRPR